MTTGSSRVLSEDQELLDYLLLNDGLRTDSGVIRPRPPGAAVPLSFAQLRLWSLYQVVPQSTAYNIFNAVRFRGDLHVDHFREALNEVIRRHETLRAAFTEDDGKPSLYIRDTAEIPFDYHDLRGMDSARQEEVVRSRADEIANFVFDVGRPPLLRAGLLRTADQEYTALICMHHIVADGWSMQILLRETAAIYEAKLAGLASPLLNLRVQYGDFAIWQRSQEAELARQLEYWKHQLKDLANLDLPTDFARPPAQTFEGAVHPIHLPADLLSKLRALAAESGASLFMVLLAGFQALLAKYSGQASVAIGTPVANRNREEVEPLIGFFVNMLVMRGELGGNPGFRALLKRTKEAALAAYAHQDVPFESVVRALELPRDASRNPLYQVVFAMHNSTAMTDGFSGMTALEPPPAKTAKFDLSLLLDESRETVSGVMEYSTRLFRGDTIERLANHYVRLLESMVANPDSRLSEIGLLTESERADQVSWNATERAIPDAGLAELFAETVSAYVAEPAAIFGGRSLTYGELNARANRLAWYLRQQGVGAESLVGMSVEEGLDAVLTMLAAIKAGAAYVPLRSDDPRRAEMAARLRRDEGMRWLVVSGEKPAIEGLQVISLAEEAAAIAGQSESDLPLAAAADQLAYVIHTSGSTGIPKGIAVTQAGVVRLVRESNYLQVWPGMRMGQISTYAFDAVTFEVWGALLNGGCLVEVPREVRLWPRRLAEWIRSEKIDAMFLTAALFNQVASEVPTAFSSMDTLLVGGEALTAERVREVLEAGGPRRLLNGYGPTECTTFALWHPIGVEDTEGSVPIGRPLSNTEAWVLGGSLEPQPVGVLGEIGLAGPGLARGYLGDARMTAERFVPHPCGRRAGERLYLTGDWGRWRADGVMEYAGRRDGQIKLRGFRIEPGEIEAALKAHPGVRDAAVGMREGRLCAWTAAEPDLTAAELRRHLESRLPHYMLPAAIATLPSLPLNANGKIDRPALPEIEIEQKAGPLPRTEAEIAVAEVWQSVLRQPGPIALDTNYFAAGGDSITAIQIVSRLVQKSWQATLKNLHLHPTIAEFAATLERAGPVVSGSEERGTQGEFPLGPAQRWFLAHHRGRSSRFNPDRFNLDHFNQSVMLASTTPLLRDPLQKALDFLVAEHEMLRARFRIEPEGEAAQWIAAPEKAALEEIDLSGATNWRSALESEANRIQDSLNLQRGPVFRAAWLHLGNEDRLLLTAHHLVVDGVSWRILLDDLDRAYAAAARGEVLNSQFRSVSYAHWTREVERLSALPVFRAETEYWRELLAEQDAGNARAARGRYGSMESVTVSLDPAETNTLLTEPARAFGASAQEVLLAALASAFRRQLGESSTWIDLEGHGREPLEETASGREWDTSRTVGWFTGIFPFRLATTADAPSDRLIEVKEALRAVPRKGAGYGILRYMARPDIEWVEPAISFNYLGQFGDGEKAGMRFASESTGQTIDPELESPHDLDIVALASGTRMLATFHFQPSRYSREFVERLADDFRQQAALLAETCRAAIYPIRTPSDFPVACLSWTQYRGLLDTNGWRAEEIEEVYPLSPLQAGLLFESLSAPDGQAYFIQVSYRLCGKLDMVRFEQSWQYLMRRNPVLRTSFVHEGLDEPLQVVFRERALPFRVVDLSGLDEQTQSERTMALEAQDRARGFQLDRDPLMRVTVVILGPGKYQVIWSYHHLLLDGWCLGVLHEDLLDFLSHGEGKRATPLPYGSYIRWVRAQDHEEALAFWAQYLAGHEGIQSPPRDIPGGTSRPEQFSFTLNDGDCAALRGVADTLRVTLNSVLQAIWGAILGRYCATDDCVFGTVVSGRPSQLPGVESTIGLFINAVPVRVCPEGKKRFSELAQELHDNASAREPYQYVPLAEIQRLHGGTIFDHLLTFENYPLHARDSQESVGEDVLRIEGSTRAHDRTHYSFGLTIVPGDEIEFRIDYDSSLFSRELVESIGTHWREAVRLISAEPNIELEDFSFVSAAERELLVRGFQPEPVSRVGSTVVARIREQAAKSPNEPAVVCGSRWCSYQTLDQASDRVAAGLRGRAIPAASKVGLLLDRSEKMVSSVLGVLKAGCAFVPIEPGTPADRVRFILEDSGASAVLVEPKYRSLAGNSIRCIDPEEFDVETGAAPSEPDVDALAYIIYTSGSTGQPKGCQITHANLDHYLSWALGYYFGEGGGSFPLFTPLSFDLTITSLFLPLMSGRTLHVFPNEIPPGEVLAEVLRPDSGIDAVKLTPSHMSLIEDTGCETTRLRVMIVGGEALPLERVRACQQLNENLAIYNEYGPTETTVGCIVRRIEPNDRRVLIGRPIANTFAYVVDDRMRLCPVGVAGEILIGGAGVSRGYIRREELNAEKFIDDPFRADATVYRTGDLGRWLPGGQMEYLGRADDQVKIRGFRIEPGEIVRCLESSPDAGACAVLPDRSGSRLLAFYTGSAEPDSLRQRLSGTLPEYMVPSAFVKVDAIPVTRNGKTDKAALLGISEAQRRSVSGAAQLENADAVEAAIIAIWKEVLDTDEVGLDTDFFSAGGHSLRAMQAASRIRQRLNARISLAEILRSPTPRQLAVRVRACERQELEPIPLTLWEPDYPLSSAQRRLWMVNQWDTGAVVAHNMHHALRLQGEVDAVALERAFQAVIDRHDSLRTGFIEVAGEPRQRIQARIDFRLETCDLRSEPRAEEQARRMVAQDAEAPFDTARPPLVRARLIRLGEGDNILSLVMHHLVGDGWSMTVFFTEAVTLYRAFQRGAGNSLHPLRIQYKDFVAWQLRQPIREAERYWLEKLDGAPQELRLPWDTHPDDERDFRGAVYSCAIGPEVTEKLEALARRHGATLATVVLSVLAAWLYAWTRQEDFCIGMSVAGRDHPDTEGLIGFFVNMLPIRIRPSKDKDFGTLLDEIQESCGAAIERQHYPFDRLIQVLNPERALNRQPLVNVVYAFQNFSDIRSSHTSEEDDPEVRITEFEREFVTSKFDLTFFVSRTGDGLQLNIEYDTGLFRSATIEKGAANIQRFAAAIAGENAS